MSCLKVIQISEKTISVTFELKKEISELPKTMIQNCKTHGRLPLNLILDTAVFVHDTVFLNKNLI